MAAAENALTARVGLALSRMSERERRLVTLTAVVALVALLAILSSLMGKAVDSRRKRVALRRDEIAQLETLRGKYQEAVVAEESSRTRVTGNTASLFSLLQKSASEVGLALSDLSERRVPVKDVPDVVEVTVDLNLKDISVDKLSNLLEKVEGRSPDGVVKVTKLKVKTRFDNPEMLEANMTVSTWKAAASASGAPAGEAP